MPKKSFVPLDADHPFPIQNLPFGIFRPSASLPPRAGTPIGDFVLDLAKLEEEGLLPTQHLFRHSTLNPFMAAGRPVWQSVRKRLQILLAEDNPTLRDNEALREVLFWRRDEVVLEMPALIGDYTDFYSSREHATNVGSMFRDPNNALLPNWLHLPVAYHGRASSVVLSGTPIRRPSGQLRPQKPGDSPTFGASKQLDFELEVGAFVGDGNPLGAPIPIENAADHILGLVLVNDWSARDIQSWEYRPLGPFLAKNFATTISPWIVTLDALEPFRTASPAQQPIPLPYLQFSGEQSYDIQLAVELTPADGSPTTICQSNYKHLYWTLSQQVAHHTTTGCNLRPGDLLASGTISGPTPDSYGSLLELSWRGTRPLTLMDGNQRTFLQDGDTIRLTAFCQGEGYQIGFGACEGKVVTND